MDKSAEELAKLFTSGKRDLGELLEGYIYGRWPSVYIYHLRSIAADPRIKLRYPQSPESQAIDDLARLAAEKTLPTLLSAETSTYHGKVLRLDEARAIINVNRNLTLTNLEKVIPYKHARDMILNSPDRIAVIDCPCRDTKDNPCRPIDVCLIIGEPFVGFILEHKTNNARRVSQDEALGILKAEDDRGHVHTAWFKDATGDRFYSICNCCRCCCAAMRAHSAFHVPMLACSGYVAKIGEDCNACGECADFCQFGAIIVDGDVRILAEKCMGCGVCESKCPRKAISLERDPARGEPLDLRVLAPSE